MTGKESFRRMIPRRNWLILFDEGHSVRDGQEQNIRGILRSWSGDSGAKTSSIANTKTALAVTSDSWLGWRKPICGYDVPSPRQRGMVSRRCASIRNQQKSLLMNLKSSRGHGKTWDRQRNMSKDSRALRICVSGIAYNPGITIKRSVLHIRSLREDIGICDFHGSVNG